MFYYLEGKIAHLEPGVAVVDCGGVGYLCHVSARTQSRLSVGQKGRLYTHLHVREDTFELYGFAEAEEKNVFLLLGGVSGVGVKASLAILSAMSPEQFILAVLNGDEKALCSAQGVGKKLAQRMILELKDKFKKEYTGMTASESFDFSGGETATDKLGEARMAMQALGYTAAEASAALKGIDCEVLSLEQILKEALKKMMK